MAPVRIAVIGAGSIGRKHLGLLETDPGFSVVGICDTAPAAATYARERGIALFSDVEKMLDDAKPEGVIIASPNHLHVPMALACIARRIPAIVEKPVADTVETAQKLVKAAADAKVPMLTGHHRRHNPLLRAAADFVHGGGVGQVTAVSGTWLTRKPDDYYDMAWRREAGGGPVLINAIHDVDCMRMICGEIESVQAVAASAARGFAVEDSAAAILRFASGAIGTFLISDAVPSPWSWELSSGENTFYPHETENCYLIAGTKASLGVPRLDIWWDEKRGGWAEPLMRRRVHYIPGDPYIEQLRHFARVIRDGEKPVIDVAEGTRTLATTLALTRAAANKEVVRVDDVLKGAR